MYQIAEQMLLTFKGLEKHGCIYIGMYIIGMYIYWDVDILGCTYIGMCIYIGMYICWHHHMAPTYIICGTNIYICWDVYLHLGSTSSRFLICKPPNKETPPGRRISFDHIASQRCCSRSMASKNADVYILPHTHSTNSRQQKKSHTLNYNASLTNCREAAARAQWLRRVP